MSQALAIAALVIPAAILGAAGIASLAGLLSLRTADPNVRSGLPTALVASAVVAAIVGFGAWQVAILYACFLSTSSNCVDRASVFIGPIAAVLSAVASLGAYGLIARRWRGRAPYVGVALGPAALLGAVVLATGISSGLNGVAATQRQDDDAAALAARSAALHLAVADVRTTMSGDGETVLAVHLRATLTSDRDLRFDHASKNVFPRFVITAPGAVPADGQPTQAGPVELLAGTPADFDLDFDMTAAASRPVFGVGLASTFVSPRPGAWQLRVNIKDDSGLDYLVEVNVDVAAPA